MPLPSHLPITVIHPPDIPTLYPNDYAHIALFSEDKHYYVNSRHYCRIRFDWFSDRSGIKGVGRRGDGSLSQVKVTSLPGEHFSKRAPSPWQRTVNPIKETNFASLYSYRCCGVTSKTFCKGISWIISFR